MFTQDKFHEGKPCLIISVLCLEHGRDLMYIFFFFNLFIFGCVQSLPLGAIFL